MWKINLFMRNFLTMYIFFQTRFLGQFNDTVRIPHRFEDDEDKRIIAFIKVRIYDREDTNFILYCYNIQFLSIYLLLGVKLISSDL